MASRSQDGPTGGELAAEISTGIVALLRSYTGRGPERAHTSMGREHVLVMLRETLTQGERTLVEAGHSQDVLNTRKRYQEVLRPDAVELVERLTRRRVIGFMSENHIDPDLAAEIFVLEAGDGRGELGEGQWPPAAGD